MAKKAIVELELQTDSYKASLVEIQKGNTTISESASKAAQTAQAAFTETGKAAKAAFASTEVKKALTDQTAGIDKLAASLQKLIQEQVDLLAAGKKQSDEFKKNQAEIARVNGEIAKLTKQTEQLATAEDKTTKKSQSLTAQLRAMKQELALLEQEGKDGTAQFQNLAIAAGRLEDQIGDTRERVRVLASDTFVFDAAVDSVSTLAGAFSAVQGAVGLFADDNEELQRAIAKTNSALAILNGLQQVNAFVTGNSSGKIAIENVLRKINNESIRQSAISYNILGRSVQFTAVQLNFLKAAFASIGIGLIVFGITELISAFQRLSAENERFTNAFKTSAEAIKKSGEGIKELQDIALDAEDKLAVAAGKITQNQADLRKELKNVKETAGQAYAPLISAQLDLQKNLKAANAEIQKQTQLRDAATNSRSEGAPLRAAQAQKALNAALLNRDKTEKELLKIEARKQEVSKNSVRAQVAVINASEIEEDKKKKVIKQQRILIELLSDEAIKRSKVELATLKSLATLSDFEDTTTQTRIETRENFIKKNEILEGSSLARRINLIELEGERRKADTFDQIDDAKKRQSAIELIEAETQAAIRAERQRTKDESIRLAFQYAQEFSDVLTSLNELSRQNTENQIADIERRQAVELEAINNSLDTERQKERQRSALTLRTNQKIAAEKTKQAKQDKALAIFNATIQTAQAIVGFLANPGGIPGIALSVLAGITGAAQIAAISSRPIPKFEKGGKVGGKRHSQGGTLIEAEVDEFVTRRGQSIRHRSELEAINRSTAEYHRLIQRNYVRPAIARVLADRKQDKPTFNLNATLNSKKMEGELKGLRKDIRRSKQRNYTNQTDSRYQWHNK